MRAFPFISLLPFVFLIFSIAGIVLVTLGVRGRPIFAAPRCRKCGYDLRNVSFTSDEVGNCPECGTPLSSPNAVTFGRWRRQPKKIVWGVVLVALPWVVGLAMMFVVRNRMVTAVTGPGALPSQSTATLLAALPANLNTPWHWQELERRLKANQLTQADVDAAFASLTTSLNADRAAGKDRQPLHWCGTFISAAITSSSVSQAKVDALCQAYYGMAPPFQLRDRARAGRPVRIVLNEHDPWDIEGFQRCWALSDVTIDGASKIPLKRQYGPQTALKPEELSGAGNNGEIRATIDSLGPGEHEIAFTYDVGIVSRTATFRGIDGKPGTPDRWPQTVSRWQALVKRKVTVTPPDQSPLTTITDPTRDPFKSSKLTVEEALVRRATAGVELVINWKVTGNPDPVASYRIAVQAGEERIDFGKMVFGVVSRRGTYRSMPDRKQLKSLPASVRSIDITLTPDPVPAEEFIDVNEVWGGPLELKDVPLGRFDVETPK